MNLGLAGSALHDLRAAGPRILACLGLASAVVLAASPAQYLGRQHDDILFVIASHAMSFGEYVLFTSPGRPPLTHVSPGLPFLLMPVTWLAGEWMPAFQLFSSLVMAACPWLAWLWLRRRLDRASAVLAALLFATSPITLSQAGCVMPEGAYTLMAAALLLTLDGRNGQAAPAGWLLLALTQLRPAGLSLLPAALARPLAGRRWVGAAVTAALPLAGLAAWAAWSWARSGSTQEASEWARGYAGAGLLAPVSMAVDNGRFYLAAFGGCFLPPSLAAGTAAALAGAGLAVLCLAGAAACLREDPFEPAAWMLAGAAAMHAFWPWQYERYLIPLLPWLFWTLCRGLGRRAAPALAVLLCLQVPFHTLRCLGRGPYAEPELRETYAWLRAHSEPHDVLASPLYARDGYLAGRPSVPLPDDADPAAFAGRLASARARYVLWQDGLDLGLALGPRSPVRAAFERTGRHLGEAGLFRLAYANQAEGSRVFEPVAGR